MFHELIFWLVVGLVAVVAVLLFKFLAAKLPFPGLQTLGAAV